MSLDDTLALAARHGISLVELRGLANTLDLPAYLAATYGSPAALAARMRDSRVQIVAFDASLRLVGGSKEERDQLEALSPWADSLGVRWIRVFDGGKNAGPDELAAAQETVRWWGELRTRKGWQVDLMVETHDSLLNAATLSRFVRALPATAILWDAHHTWRKGGEDPAVTWPAIRSSVVHVHVKDSVDRLSARHPFTYVLPGDGGFPIERVLGLLRSDAFPGAVSLEWEKLWHPYLPSLEDALATAAQRGWW